MSIELIDLDKYPLVVSVQADGTAMVYAPNVCDGVAADLLRNLAAQMEAGHPPYSCKSGAPASGGWFSSDLVWVDSSGRSWDLRESYRSAGNLLWHWTGANERGVPLMSTSTGSMVQSLDVVLALYTPVVVAGGRG
ncbi:phiSA1p31-related protein [Streptomyces sp. bgisy029]|uniref:phiSA1p31-related protein n=1 Tax=Streptomyces sp. bgisy029 TaxID=3413771 RepID=UPI003D717835